MKYYAACLDSTGIRAALALRPCTILLSYHHFKTKQKMITKLLSRNVNIFIDSGAFSVYVSGSSVDIDAYCDFIQKVKPTYYAALDVIGDAAASYENLKYMETRYELNPIPTFHRGSPIEALDKMLQENYEYIALGGIGSKAGTTEIIKFCDTSFRHILTYAPHTKVHGFGVSAVDVMSRYPWYSVDGSAFMGCWRFGRQSMITSGITIGNMPEGDFARFLQSIGITQKELLTSGVGTSNSNKRRIQAFFSAASFQIYAAHLTELHKLQDFSYLTNQTRLI